ncbi:hypothetical protein ACROYT_G012614 [Oculina patagonica]
MDILQSYNLSQHVTEVTHISGHTLDLVITKSNDAFLGGVSTFDPVISDHSAVNINLLLQKPQFKKKTITYRKLHSIDFNTFCNDITDSPQIMEPSSDLDGLVDQYDNVLRSLLDRHAPTKQRTVTVRPSAPWYSTEIAQNKRIRRKLERKWRSTRLPSDRELYVHQCSVVNNLIDSAKSAYYTTIISEISGDQRTLFKTVNKLLQKQKEQQYPSSFSDSTSLANAFNNFFISKVDKIHNTLMERTVENDLNSPRTTDRPSCNTEIHNFQQVTLDQVKVFATKTSSKSCELDPVPASVLKACLPVILPTLTSIINMSLMTGIMPHALKVAVLRPLLKKQDADTEQLQNFRPISNLKFVSKLIEKAVASQLNDHILKHHLGETFQSAYKRFHSTETALQIFSTFLELERGVPQGSVLGPLLYLLYTSPLADIIKRHNLEYHFYADDTQLYVAFKTDSLDRMAQCKTSIEQCVCDIDNWMAVNKLKLNQEKTEVVLISSRYRPRPPLESLQIGNVNVVPTSSARNLGAIFDQCFNLEEHIKSICKSSHYHIRNLAKIRKYIDEEGAKTVVHAFITSKLDNCNSLLYGLPQHLQEDKTKLFYRKLKLFFMHFPAG